jgi:flavin-binding protein dodecin
MEGTMSNAVYRATEIVGSSDASVSEAIRCALERASKTLRHLDWFEVTQIRGSIDPDARPSYQVTMKVGFRLEEPT